MNFDIRIDDEQQKLLISAIQTSLRFMPRQFDNEVEALLDLQAMLEDVQPEVLNDFTA